MLYKVRYTLNIIIWNTIHPFIERNKLSKMGLRGIGRSGKMSWRKCHLRLVLKDGIADNRDCGMVIINTRKSEPSPKG